ncbi:MAG TPA: HEAT repeat domain-containing protein [Pyrinomonadaceae bacterium]
MPRSHLFPGQWRIVLLLLASCAVSLFFMSGQAGAQKKKQKPATRTGAAPAATPQANQQSAQKSQKLNLVRMRTSDTSDGSNVSLESDGVLNKYSAYRSGDKFYVVVPDLDAQRAQSNLRGRGFENVQVQKSGGDTVLMFHLQPGAKASVRQRFNRLDVVFTTPGGATNANQNAATQTQSSSNTPAANTNQSGTRATAPAQTQGGTTTTAPNGGNTNPTNTVAGAQTPYTTPYTSSATPLVPTATPPETYSVAPVESPAPSPMLTPPADQIAQAQNPANAAQPASNLPQQPATVSPSLATTLARRWPLLLIVGLVLVSLGLVIAARAKARRTDVKTKEKREVRDEQLATAPEAPKLRAVPAATTAAVAATTAAKKAEQEKTSAAAKKAERKSSVKESSTVKETKAAEVPVKESPAKEAAAEKIVPAKEAAPVTMADIESASAEVKNLLAGHSYNDAVIGSSDRGTRQAVAAELLAALASRNPERREHARVAFIKHNYLDEATFDLRTAEAPAERSSAARALGLSQDQTATPHLIAALEDDVPEVRRAVIEALAELRDPSAVEPLEALLKREQDRKVPHGLIRRAIEASKTSAAEQAETTTIEAAAPVVAAQEETPTPQAVAPALDEETQTVESAPVAATPAAVVADEKPAIANAGIVAAEVAAASLLSEGAPVETPAEVSAPLSAEVVAPSQRTDSRKLRKKQARQKRAEEQSRKIAGAEAARQKEQQTAAQSTAEAEAARLLAAEQQRALEAEARQQEEEAARQQEEARQAAEAERLRLEAEAQRKAEETAARERAEAEARRQAEAESRRQAEAEARRVAEEEASRIAVEARQRAEEEERQRVAAEAGRKAEEEAAAARLHAEEELRQAEEALRLAEAEEATRVAAESARVEAEAARLRAEEQARQQAEEDERRRVEAERQRLAAEAAASQRAEEERQRAEQERQRVEAEARARAEEEARQQAEAQARDEAEAARQRAEEERARVEEESRQRAAEEARLRAEAESRRQAEAEAARLRAQEEAAARLRAEEAARLMAEQEARRVTEEARLAEEARRAAEEATAVRVTEADLITEIVPAVSAGDSLIERNDGSEAGWFNIEVDQAATPAATSSVSSSSAANGSPQGELPLTPPPVVHETVASSAIEIAEESPAGVSREIDRAVTERGIAEPEDDFSTVPNSILRRLGSENVSERAEAVSNLGRLGGDDAFREISAAFDDPSQEVRNAAARSLFDLNTDRAASFTRALREAPAERRRHIGAALASSGLAGEAISHLMGESRERTYDAFSLLFLMSKAGEVQPLMRAIEEHPNNEVRLAVVKLLALSGQQEILPAFRRLAVRGSLPTEVRSAVMEAIYQISSQSPTDASSRV